MAETIEVACECGRVLRAPAEAAGKRGRCKGCGATVEIPRPEPPGAIPLAATAGVPSKPDADIIPSPVWATIETDEDDAPIPDAIRRAAPPPIPAGVSVLKPPAPARALSPPEPWYYGFLVIAAQLVLGIGGLLGTCLIVIGFTMSSSDRGTIPGILLAAYGVATLASTCFVSAPVLLAVDLARNIRAMRYGDRF